MNKSNPKAEIINVLQYVWERKIQHFAYLMPSLFLIFISVFPEEFKKLTIFVQVAFVLMALLISYIAVNYPAIEEANENRAITKSIEKLQKQVADNQTKIDHYEELKTLLAKFLDNAGIYREKVIDLLNLEDDYLCISKSSEGMGKIYEEKLGVMFPFSKVLYEWPGSLKPFEHMQLYLIPLKNFPGLNKNNVRHYVNKVIIPKVQRERKAFLDSLPKGKAKLAEEFSYKYLAFVIKGKTVTFDTRNRKFIKQFVNAFISSGTKRNIAKYTKALGEVIGLKEFFLRVEWDAFADLNRTQLELVETNKDRIYGAMKRASVSSLREMYSAGTKKITQLLLSALAGRITEKKAMNISEKLIIGAKNVIDVLEKAGVEV